MAHKYSDDERSALRFSDVSMEPRRLLPPILGYEDEPLVSLEEAIQPLVPLVPEVERMAGTVKQHYFEGKDGLSDEESASILLYTLEWYPSSQSFYAILNNTLKSANRQLLRPWFRYLRLVLTALAKLPREGDRFNVYRGVKRDLAALYPTGATVTWWSMSSCTKTIDVLNQEQFLGRQGTRTLFTIECFSGKSIRHHSLIPEEEEVLLPPACQFRVTGSLNQGNGLHIVQLQEIKPKYPLINPVSLPPLPLPRLKPVPTPTPQPKPTQIPDCGDSRLQKHINALYNDPVSTTLKRFRSIRLTMLLSPNHDAADYTSRDFPVAYTLLHFHFPTQALTSLNLYDNQIGAVGAQHLVTALRENKVMSIEIWSHLLISHPLCHTDTHITRPQ